MLPLRGVLESLGGSVEYDGDVGSVNAQLNGHKAIVAAGNDIAYVDGDAARLPVAPTTIGGELYVPARLFADAFGADISWDGATGTVTLVFEFDSKSADAPPTAISPGR
jgi:hypothetical protein